MVVQPTGSGKSLCFQLPALLLPGLVIVVSPLTAHARDAISRLPKSVPAGLCLGGDFKRASMVSIFHLPGRHPAALYLVTRHHASSFPLTDSMNSSLLSFITSSICAPCHIIRHRQII
jgi:hypothetical protein